MWWPLTIHWSPNQTTQYITASKTHVATAQCGPKLHMCRLRSLISVKWIIIHIIYNDYLDQTTSHRVHSHGNHTKKRCISARSALLTWSRKCRWQLLHVYTYSGSISWVNFPLALQKTAPATPLAMSVVSRTPPMKLATAAPTAVDTSTRPLSARKNML